MKLIEISVRNLIGIRYFIFIEMKSDIVLVPFLFFKFKYLFKMTGCKLRNNVANVT